MADRFTQNLKLRLSPDLTADARFNLLRLDRIGASILSNTQNQTIIRSISNILLEPDSPDIGGDGLVGTIFLGLTGRPIEAVNVNASTFNLRQALLNIHPNLNYKISLRGPASLAADYTLTLPETAGTLGQVLRTDGTGTLDWADLETAELSENHLEIGGVGDVRTSVDTGALGSILASTGAGLTIKSGSIADAQLSSSAGISLSKLASLTSDRAVISNSVGEITASSVTSTELGYLSGADSNIQAQINSLIISGVPQTTAVWEPTDGTTKTINHSLNSQALEISVLNISDDYANIEVSSIKRPTTGQVILTASEAPSSDWLVLISKVGT